MNNPPFSVAPPLSNVLHLHDSTATFTQATQRAARAASALAARGEFPLVLAPQDREEWLGNAERRRQERERTMCPELRRCYSPASGAIRFRNGHPDVDNARLRRWLREQWKSLQTEQDYPLAAPTGTRPADWTLAARCLPEVAVWEEYEYACKLLRSLGNMPQGSQTTRLAWKTEPRLALCEPEWGTLLGRQQFRPQPGHMFLVMDLPDLESRCLFAVCRQWFPERAHAVPSNQADWNQEVADALQLTAAGAAMIAAALMLGTGLLLSDLAVARLIEHSTGTFRSPAEIGELRERLVRLFPELDRYELRSLREFRGKFDVTGRCGGNDRLRMHQLHLAAFTGTTQTLLAQFEDELHFDARQRLSRWRTDSGDRTRLADELLAVPRRTSSGQVIGPSRFGVATAEFLDLADDFRQQLLVELIALGYSFIAWKEQVVGMLPEKVDHSAIEARLRHAVTRIGESMLGGAPYVEIGWPESW